jgi:hypothetical protein
VDDRVTGPHLSVEDVDLDLADRDRRHDRSLDPGRAPTDDHGSGQQLFG